jgi:diacylglycerol kinase family enzyme
VARLVPLAAANRLDRSGNSQSWTCASFTVESRSGTALAGVDGEALELATPLEFRIHPGGLRLLVPEGNLEAAEQRRSRDVRFRNVLAVAMGEPNMA